MRKILVALAFSALTACGSSSPSEPTTPQIDPAGTWSGTLVGSEMTLTLVNAHGTISGTSDMTGALYTVAGTFDSSDHLRLAMTLPNGAVRTLDAPVVLSTSMAATVKFPLGVTWPVALTRRK